MFLRLRLWCENRSDHADDHHADDHHANDHHGGSVQTLVRFACAKMEIEMRVARLRGVLSMLWCVRACAGYCFCVTEGTAGAATTVSLVDFPILLMCDKCSGTCWLRDVGTM